MQSCWKQLTAYKQKEIQINHRLYYCLLLVSLLISFYVLLVDTSQGKQSMNLSCHIHRFWLLTFASQRIPWHIWATPNSLISANALAAPRVLIGSSLVKSRKSMTIAKQKDWDWKLVTTIVGKYLPLLVYLMGSYGETTTSWSPPSANSTPLVKKCLKLRWQISWAPSIQRILVNPDAFQSFAPLLCHSQGNPLISPSIQCQSLMEKTAESITCWPPRRLWFPSLQPKIA